MADLHKGIRAIHNNVVTINGDTQEDIIAWDKDDNKVSINSNFERPFRSFITLL